MKQIIKIIRYSVKSKEKKINLKKNINKKCSFLVNQIIYFICIHYTNLI